MATKVYLELGSKRVFACALDWPGWCRSGRDEESALSNLADYAARYAAAAAEAGVSFPATAGERLQVVERLPGSSATDFGVPEAKASADRRRLSRSEAERLAAIVEVAWKIFDRVAAGAPAELRKGPRGGGRDRDKIVNHVNESDAAYARSMGLRIKQTDVADTARVAAMRAAILDALRAARAPFPEREKAWPYRYAARRIAWHALDHAWEIEDRST